MSDVNKAKKFLEDSLLSPLLSQPDITDITYNGESLFYQSSLHGRKQATITMDYLQAYQLIKQLANYMNVPFTYLDPILDLSVAHYRIFAVGPSISRKQYQPTLTFAIRIHPALGTLRHQFLTATSPWTVLFTFLIHRAISLVIAGKTGSGKTQLQKECLMLMPTAQRVIVLDNILELDGLSVPHIDLTIWQLHSPATFTPMVAGALRSHPDWILIAEARGKEFQEVFRSVKTGHPIITTIHSEAIDQTYARMVSMLLIEESIALTMTMMKEVETAFPVLIYLTTKLTPMGLERQIDSVWITHAGKRWRIMHPPTQGMIDQVISQWV